VSSVFVCKSSRSQSEKIAIQARRASGKKF
jgi:hypothetical protein